MREISGELRQLLGNVRERFRESGVTEYVVIVEYKGESIVSSEMTPQRTLLYLIDSLQTTKEQCLRQTQQSSEKQNS